MLLAEEAHWDDVRFYASATVAKLVQEGYTGYPDVDSRFTPDSFPRQPELPAVNRPNYPTQRRRDTDTTEGLAFT